MGGHSTGRREQSRRPPKSLDQGCFEPRHSTRQDLDAERMTGDRTGGSQLGKSIFAPCLPADSRETAGQTVSVVSGTTPCCSAFRPRCGTDMAQHRTGGSAPWLGGGGLPRATTAAVGSFSLGAPAWAPALQQAAGRFMRTTLTSTLRASPRGQGFPPNLPQSVASVWADFSDRSCCRSVSEQAGATP